MRGGTLRPAQPAVPHLVRFAEVLVVQRVWGNFRYFPGWMVCSTGHRLPDSAFCPSGSGYDEMKLPLLACSNQGGYGRSSTGPGYSSNGRAIVNRSIEWFGDLGSFSWK